MGVTAIIAGAAGYLITPASVLRLVALLAAMDEHRSGAPDQFQRH